MFVVAAAMSTAYIITICQILSIIGDLFAFNNIKQTGYPCAINVLILLVGCVMERIAVHYDIGSDTLTYSHEDGH